MNVQLLNIDEALKEMDQLIKQETYRTWIGDKIKEFNTLTEWFQNKAAYELGVNTNKAYLDIFKTNKSLMINLKDKYTNKLLKKLYFNSDITKDFTLAYDGLYYNEAWSKSGKKIVVDGLGWNVNQVREYMLQYEVIPTIQENIETLKDSIRSYFN